MLIDIIRAAYY